MKIGLIDVDGHNFPNLALMKISAWHKKRGHSVEFADIFGEYDIIYKSKVFTWSQDNEYAYKTDTYMEGGTGYGLTGLWLQDEIEHICPDYALYNCDHAYGFLTRGCIRKCGWCIVPEKEGGISDHTDIDEFISNKKSVILMDNNILASPSAPFHLNKLSKIGVKIDFNQGLDARLIDRVIADYLRRVKWIRYIRMACDSESMIQHIENAVKLLRADGRKREIFVYVLVKDIDDAYNRVEFLRSIDVMPFAQPYRDYTENKGPEYEQRRFARWVNHKAVFKTVPWDEYR